MKLKIAFFGTPEYSLLVLERLFHSDFSIVCVVTKPDRPVGRKQVLTPTPVAEWASAKQIPVITPQSQSEKPWLFADESRVTNEILSFSPDVIVSADYTMKIPFQLIKQIKYGSLNVHPSLLPSYRGPAPVPWAIFNGEKETGVSIVTLSETFDAGEVLAQEKEPIQPTDTTSALLQRLFTKGAELLLDTLPKFLKSPKTIIVISTITPSYFPRLTRDHGFEPWKNIKLATETGEQAARIERKWRAFNPWPGLWTKVKLNNNEKRLKLPKIHLLPATGNSQPLLVLDEIQLEGKTPVSGKELFHLIPLREWK